MGNLIQVTEPAPEGGTHETYYAYNMRNQLTQVSMPRDGVTQTRSFNYDPATGRLMSTTNPENGTVSYTYNTNGTLATKTDAKQQRTEYSYDQFQRVTKVRHYVDPYDSTREDGAQRITYTYDAGENGWGRLAYAQTGFIETTSFNYTPGGLVRGKSGISYAYDNEGRVTSMGYPGRLFYYTYDTLGRPVKLTDASEKEWVTQATWGPGGELQSLTRVNDWNDPVYGEVYMTEAFTYDPRLQLTRQRVTDDARRTTISDLEYRYPATANNGRISQMKSWMSGEEVNYQYDSLNRLLRAETTGPEWGLSFSYDGFGNLWSEAPTKGTAPQATFLVDSATNRLGGGGLSYDANGNLISTPDKTMSYDAENRLTRLESGGSVMQFAYNAFNERSWKSDPGNGRPSVWYSYGLNGELLQSRQDYSNQPQDNIYFAGRLIWSDVTTYGANKGSTIEDRVGSIGNQYFPYGEERSESYVPGRRFATYDRESDGLYYAKNRHYSSQFMRFTSPDPYQASGGPADPQSWNRYAYVGGDPVNFNDPSGLRRCWTGDPDPEGTNPYYCAFMSGEANSEAEMDNTPVEPSNPGGGGGIPANKGGWFTDPSGIGKTAWQYLNSVWNNCLKSFESSQRFLDSGFTDILTSDMTWFDTRDPDVAKKTVDSIAHNGNPTKLSEFVGASDAKVIAGTHSAVLSPDYFTNNTQTQQIAIAIHEALHMALGINDEPLAGWLKNFGFKPSRNFVNNTHEITEWIVGTKDQISTTGGGCNNIR